MVRSFPEIYIWHLAKPFYLGDLPEATFDKGLYLGLCGQGCVAGVRGGLGHLQIAGLQVF